MTGANAGGAAPGRSSADLAGEAVTRAAESLKRLAGHAAEFQAVMNEWAERPPPDDRQEHDTVFTSARPEP